MLIKSEQLSVGSLIKNVMLKYLFWASYILRLCAQTCTPNRHALVVVVLIEIVETKFHVFACFLSERIGVQYMCTRLCTPKIKRNIELATVSLFHPPAPHPTLFISKYIIFIK